MLTIMSETRLLRLINKQIKNRLDFRVFSWIQFNPFQSFTDSIRRLCTNTSLPFRQDTCTKVLTIYCNNNTHFILCNISKQAWCSLPLSSKPLPTDPEMHSIWWIRTYISINIHTQLNVNAGGGEGSYIAESRQSCTVAARMLSSAYAERLASKHTVYVTMKWTYSLKMHKKSTLLQLYSFKVWLSTPMGFASHTVI